MELLFISVLGNYVYFKGNTKEEVQPKAVSQKPMSKKRRNKDGKEIIATPAKVK